MLSKDLKKLLKLSGGKIILSEGNLEESFVVMKLNEYLKEVEAEKEDEKDYSWESSKEQEVFEENPTQLTDDELLSRINADIAELKERKDEEVLGDMEMNEENEDPQYESV